MAGGTANGSKSDRLSDIDISESDLRLLSKTVLVSRLVERGFSRLTAERFVEIQRGTGEAGRARPHALARR
jgi:hypothetical protein